MCDFSQQYRVLLNQLKFYTKTAMLYGWLWSTLKTTPNVKNIKSYHYATCQMDICSPITQQKGLPKVVYFSLGHCLDLQAIFSVRVEGTEQAINLNYCFETEWLVSRRQ
jgi:hypothetical protein